MKIFKASVVAASVLLSCSAFAETVKITNIGHGYYSGALYVAKREKLFEKYGLEPEISFVQGGPLALAGGTDQTGRRCGRQLRAHSDLGGAGQAGRGVFQYRQPPGQ